MDRGNYFEWSPCRNQRRSFSITALEGGAGSIGQLRQNSHGADPKTSPVIKTALVGHPRPLDATAL